MSGTVTRDLEINPKKFEIGDVVYYVQKDIGKWRVNYGIVLEHYTSEICLQLLTNLDTRTVNGCLVKDFQTPTEWKKLPKGWTWDTKLFEMNFDAKLMGLWAAFNPHIDNPDEIKKAYDNGVLINVQDKDQCNFDTEIKDGKWRIVRKYDPYKRKPNYISLPYYEVYATYAEAQQVVDDHTKRMQEIAEMSDYDYSVMEIDHTLDRWACDYAIPDDTKQAMRDRILSIDNTEEVVTRVFNGDIQWKYDRNRRWQTIEM